MIVYFLVAILFCSEKSQSASIDPQEKSINLMELDLESIMSDTQPNLRLKALDKLAMTKLDFIAERLILAASIYTSKEQLVTLLQEYQVYESRKQLYGTPKDYLRTQAFRKFVASALTLLPNQTEDKNHLVFEPVAGLKIAMALRHLLPLAISKSDRLGYTGFQQALKFINAAAPAVFGGGIRVQGRDLIMELNQASKNDVNLIVMNHSHPHLDIFVMSALLSGLEKPTATISLAQGWGFEPVARVIMSNSSIISVGERNGVKYGNTTKRVLEAIGGGIRNIFLYPEGSTGAGIGEIKPIAPGFTHHLLPALQQHHKVNLLIATTLDTYPILGQLRLRKGMPPKVIVGPFIKNDKVTDIMVNDPKEMEILIRSTWAQNLPHNKDRIMGQYRISSITGALPYCAKIMQNLN